MSATFRKFKHDDIKNISNFLGYHYTTDHRDGNSLKVLWDFLVNHPCFEMFHPSGIGIWEDNGEIVGIVHLESPNLGGALLDINPKYTYLQKDMISYAERTYSGTDENGNSYLEICVKEGNIALEKTLLSMGYEKENPVRELAYSLSNAIPELKIPPGFQINTLDKVYNFNKLNELIWKGFNYKGEPPAYNDEVYLPIKHAWLDYRRDISVVVESEDKNYAAFCGMWFDEITKTSYLEPLVTASAFRNLGLGKIVVYEAMKRCQKLGATLVFVEPDFEPLNFYKNIGFEEIHKSYWWTKINM